MKQTSVLDSVWCNAHDKTYSLRRLVVLLEAGDYGPVSNGSGTHWLHFTDAVESILDALRSAQPLATFPSITVDC